jgi:hypothetical protein
MAAPGSGRRPYGSFNFRVVLDAPAGDTLGFCEVVFPEFPVAPPAARRRAPTDDGVGPTTLLLRRGFDGRTDLYDWWNEARRARKKPPARTLQVELLSEARRAVARWTFTGCRPVRLSYSPLDAQVSAVLTETLELSFERMELG